MATSADFDAVFLRLKEIMLRYGEHLVCVRDEPGDYYLDTAHIMKNKKPLFFGAVQIRKNYVSYHLMPVYVFPDLLQGMSPELMKRMQGKSCFNFKAVDEQLMSELEALTVAGFDRYRADNYVT